MSINAFKSRLNALKSRSIDRKVKTRSNGLFRPQQEVTKTTTQKVEPVEISKDKESEFSDKLNNTPCATNLVMD